MIGIAKRVVRQQLERLVWSRRFRNVFFRGLARRKYYIVARNDDHSMVFDPSQYLGESMLASRDYGRSLTDEIVAFLKDRKALQSGGALIEVGANVGTQSVYLNLAHKFDRCVFVEPDLESAYLLRANIALNGLSQKSSIVECGVGDVEGEFCLRRNATSAGQSTLRDHHIEHFVTSADLFTRAPTVNVPVVTLDMLLKDQGVSPEQISMIWMDIEGFELNALRGMMNILASGPPMALEYSPIWMSEVERLEFADLVFGHYKSVFISTAGFREVDRQGLLDLTEQSDLVCLR